MQYVTTRSFASVRRQYEFGEVIDPSLITAAEWLRGVESGAIVPARFVGTAAEVASRGVPGPGVVVYETDTKKIKIGDGSTSPNSLPVAGEDTFLTKSGNLSGLADVAAARTALGLGEAATKSMAQIAADTTLAETYGSAVGVARRLTSAGLNRSDQTISPVSTTITLGVAAAAPTIASAVRIAPKRLNSTTIDTAGDPHFRYIGAIPGRLAVSSSDMSFADYLTGGSSQARINATRISFDYTGTAVELYYRMRTTSFTYRVYVDGLPVTLDMQTESVSISSRYYLKIAFGSATTRRIDIEVVNPEFGGAAIEPTATITKPRPNLLLAAFGDSHTAGAGGVSWADTWPRRTATILGIEYANLAIGGSGYLNGTVANYRNRLTTDIVPIAPDILVFEGSWNDSSATEPDLAAEAAYCFSTLKTALPGTLLIAAGPWVVSHSVNATLDSHDETLRAQAQTAGWHGYISYRDPLNIKGSTAAWAATTVYAVGDTVVRNGFAQTCVSGHTSTGTFDQTKWRSTAIVTGTGKVGSTTGDGNADLIVQSDGIHSTALGHTVKARHVAAEIMRIARAVANGTLWAG